MSDINIIDTTLRDGHQSLWALGMRTGVMLTALDRLDEAGYEAMEFWVPASHMKKMIRDLGENTFEWLRLGTAKKRKTALRYHGGYKIPFGNIPACIEKLLVQRAIDHGITVNRMSDPWNDFPALQEEHDELRRMGMKSVVNLIYSISPRHTDEYFMARVQEAVKLKPYRLCFKDVGGLLTPERLTVLLPQVLRAAGDITVEFHNHCNNGLGPYNALVAARLGVRHIHTAVPPLADASSQPSVFNVVDNLKLLGHKIDIDMKPLREASEFLTRIAQRDGLPIGRPVAYDQSLYSQQIPGGMISNLRFQLAKIGLGQRIDEVLEECARVRADFGYPIMVTPLSQFVGTQAAFNIITGARYSQVTDEVIHFALGHIGREAIDVMDADVRDRILDKPRAREIAKQAAPPQPTLAEVRARYGESLTDEELITRVCIDEVAVDQIRKMPTPTEEPLSGSSVVDLVAALSRIKGRRYISVSKGDLSLSLSTAK